MDLAKEKEMGKLEGKVALITGASGGVGSAVAKRFIREGACVILISRSLDNLKPLYNEIEELEEFKEGSVKLIQLDRSRARRNWEAFNPSVEKENDVPSWPEPRGANICARSPR